MGAWFKVLAGTVLCVGLGCGSVVAQDEPAVERRYSDDRIAAPFESKAWTIVIYNAADFQGTNPTESFASRLQSTVDAHVVMLEDSFEDEAVIWHIVGDEAAPILQQVDALGEVDTGARVTFSHLLAFCGAFFPSEHTLVMVYQHGRAWQGVSYDVHPSPMDGGGEVTYLTPEEMRSALAGAGGVDALLFTSPCIMGSAEAAYQLRNVTGLYVASESQSSLSVWYGALEAIPDWLSEPDLSLGNLGRRICDTVQRTYDRQVYLDQLPANKHYLIPSANLSSLIIGEGMVGLPDALDSFSLALRAALSKSADAIQRARSRAQSFAWDEVIDAYDFAMECLAIPELGGASERMMAAVEQAVDYSIIDASSHPDAHGLSLYFPMPPAGSGIDPQSYYETHGYGIFREKYLNSGLDLVEQTHWDEFLDAFYESL